MAKNYLIKGKLEQLVKLPIDIKVIVLRETKLHNEKTKINLIVVQKRRGRYINLFTFRNNDFDFTIKLLKLVSNS